MKLDDLTAHLAQLAYCHQTAELLNLPTMDDYRVEAVEAWRQHQWLTPAHKAAIRAACDAAKDRAIADVERLARDDVEWVNSARYQHRVFSHFAAGAPVHVHRR